MYMHSVEREVTNIRVDSTSRILCNSRRIAREYYRSHNTGDIRTLRGDHYFASVQEELLPHTLRSGGQRRCGDLSVWIPSENRIQWRFREYR